jgi:predicted component of type VI protein secretion system
MLSFDKEFVMNLYQYIKRLFGAPRKKAPAAQNEASEKMRKMMTMLAHTQEQELTCDEVYALLDEFVELAARGEDVSKLMPLVQHHLEMCPDCREEYKVLEKIVLNVA